jgi:hypothetical protein
MRRDLKRMESDLEVTQRRLERRNQQLSKMPAVSERSAAGAMAPVVARNDVARAEYDNMVRRYTWLLEKQDSLLKLSAARDPSQMMFYVIDKANMPRLPAAPNRMLLILIALAAAGAFGLAIAFAAETPRMFMINDNSDVEYFLGAPVLAAIPETLTPTERAGKRKLRLTRNVGLLALAAILAPILVILLTYLNVFQIIANR